MVDKEEEEGLEDVLGSELMGKVREKGVVVKEFVDQMKGTKGGERNGDCKENQRDDEQWVFKGQRLVRQPGRLLVLVGVVGLLQRA